ncbi:hypothetical protein B0H34DRAFT_840756 [Crassisporium funariophilum]|nr:hypothetical protein B0H34DRAFT_840756 [Crassisporium funariophilum]
MACSKNSEPRHVSDRHSHDRVNPIIPTQMYTSSFIRKNPAKFVDTAWVEVNELKDFLREREVDELTRKNQEPIRVKQEPIRVKQEPIRVKCVPDASKGVKGDRVASPDLVIIDESPSNVITPAVSRAANTLFRTLEENGHQILELLDSDDEMEPVKVSALIEDTGMSSDTMIGDVDMEMDSNDNETDSSVSDSDSESDGDEPSSSHWLDENILSAAKQGPFKITRQCTVEVVESLSELPSYWPVPREKRAYVLDLSDPKFNLYEKNGKLMTVDALIKNAEQDSWTGCTGNGPRDSRPKIPSSIFGINDGGDIVCRRSRLTCAGYSACEHIHPALVDRKRYELDPESLEDVLQVQIDSRLREADSPEKLALIFFAICHSSPCTAKNQRGQACTGIPKLVKFNKDKIKSGHRYFVSCNNWSPHFSEGHRTSSIPSGVKDDHLKVLFSGGSLPGFEEPFPCGRIVPAHIGSRVSHCNFPHQGNGSQAALVHHACSAYRTIYVPEDPTIRKACVVPDHEEPHNHPILPPTKTPIAIKDIYRKCVETAGVVGSSVRTVDNAALARTTKLMLGTSPSLYAPTLQNNRVKQDILREVKKKTYPYGTDLPGVMHLMNEDVKKPIEERYIHGFTTTLNGGRILLTANPYLLSRIHHAKTLFVDTTFKRTVGTMKEWEVVMFDKEVERAVTIARVYSDRADCLQYKTIFDELQHVTLLLTGRPLRLKRLSKDGTLVSIGVDMEIAQALGAGDSFLPTNEPEFSKIHVQTAEEIIEFFIRACYTHAKRGIHDLKPYVTDEEYEHIINFMYLETKEEVDKFSAWVKGLKNPKVQAWWDHKVNNSWILPSLIKCLSKMTSEDWDLTPPTTNVGESQHHWTNINTGIMLALLEAILTAREIDEKVAAEIKAALETGVLKNHRNDTFTRLSRSTARATQAFKKAREGRKQKKALNVVDEELASLKDTQKENAARIKELKAAKSSMLGKGKSAKAQSNSSGKVAVTGVSKRKRASALSKVALLKKDIDTRKQAMASTSSLVKYPVSNPPSAATVASFDVNKKDDISEGADYTMDLEAPESYNFASEATYARLLADWAPEPTYAPLSDMTARANLFPQTQHTLGMPLLPHEFENMGMDLSVGYTFGNKPSDFTCLDPHTEAVFDNFCKQYGSLNDSYYQ